MSKANPIEAAEIPPHMTDRLTSAAQRKVFGNIASKRAAKKASAKKAGKKVSAPRKPAAKKTPAKVAETPASSAKE